MAQRTFTAATRTAATASRAPAARGPVARSAAPAAAATPTGVPRFAIARTAGPVAVLAPDRVTAPSRAPAPLAATRQPPPRGSRHAPTLHPAVDPRSRSRPGPPESPWEREATRFATRIRDSDAARTARPEPRPDAPTAGRPTLAHPGLGPSPPGSTPDTQSQPLPPAFRRQFEAMTGFDLSSVRILTGAKVQLTASALSARAFTQHGLIHLGAGATTGDARLLAHETAHVLQQTLATQQLARLGLTPAPAESILREPFHRSPWVGRRLARDSLNDPFSLPFYALPASLRRTLDWLDSDSLAARVTRAVPEGLNSTLGPLRQLAGWWQVGQRQADAFPARFDRWTSFRDLALETDDPSMAATMRNIAGHYGGFVGSRWTDLQQMMTYTLRVAETGAALWGRGLAAVAPTTAKRLEALIDDIGTVFDDFHPDSWVVECVRIALGCPHHLRSREAMIGWVQGLREQAEQLVQSLADSARGVTQSALLVQSLGTISRELMAARALQADFTAVAGILDDPDGFFTEGDQLRTRLERIRPQLTSSSRALHDFADVPGVVLGGLCFDLQAWRRAAVFAFFPGEFDWMSTVPAAVEPWARELEPTVFPLAADTLQGIDRWSALAVEATTETDDLGEAYSPFAKGWRVLFEPLLGLSRRGLVKRLMKRIPFLRELQEKLPAIWRKAGALFERLKDQILKTRRIMAPLWEFFIGFLAIDLPENFVSEILNRGATIIGKILRHPVRFLTSLAGAVGSGLKNFGLNIGNHLLDGLLDWLLGEFELSRPATFGDVLGALLKRIKLTIRDVSASIAKYLTERGRKLTTDDVQPKIVKAIEIGAIAVQWAVLLYRGEFAKFWAEIKNQLGRVRDWVVQQAISFAIDKLKEELPPRLVELFTPGIMAVFRGIKTVYDAIQTIARYIQQVMTIVNKVFTAVAEIAEGKIERAAQAVETAAAKALSVALGFLARFAGLGAIKEYLEGKLEAVGKWVTEAINRLVAATGRIWISIFDAAEAAKDWMHQKRSFDDRDGNRRTLYYEADPMGPGVRLHITVPQSGGYFAQGAKHITLEAYLKNFIPADAHEKKVKAEIEGHARDIDEIRDTKSISVERGEGIYIRFNEIVRLLNELGADRVVPPQTEVEWKTKNISGQDYGWDMTASPLSIDPGGHIGSDPVSTSTKLWHDVQGKYSDSHYIKGHLLNHNLHGPGTWKNMIPIARSTNTKMGTSAEKHLKEAVRSENRVAHYHVHMVFGEHRRKPKTTAESLLPSKVELSAYYMKYKKGAWRKTDIKIFTTPPLENELR